MMIRKSAFVYVIIVLICVNKELYAVEETEAPDSEEDCGNADFIKYDYDNESRHVEEAIVRTINAIETAFNESDAEKQETLAREFEGYVKVIVDTTSTMLSRNTTDLVQLYKTLPDEFHKLYYEAVDECLNASNPTCDFEYKNFYNGVYFGCAYNIFTLMANSTDTCAEDTYFCYATKVLNYTTENQFTAADLAQLKYVVSNHEETDLSHCVIINTKL